jgi:uncharacterized repeat protein (TIGR01451 family)
LCAVAGLIAMAIVASSFGIHALGPDTVAPDVVINEVAWGGTAANSSHEWLELYNNKGSAIDLSGWTLVTDDGSPRIDLVGAIPPQSYYLLERVSDCAVSDVPAGQTPYSGVLGNGGERLELRDGAGALIDSVDGGAGWPAGSGSPGHYTMERIDPTAPGGPANWASNDGIHRNGLDCHGDPINGTPQARNSATPMPGADLRVDKLGPPAALRGQVITYTVVLSNVGPLAAQSVWLTDGLPAQVEFVAHSAPYPFDQPLPGKLVWYLGTVPATTTAAPIAFTINARVGEDALGEMANVITATSLTPDRSPTDNHDTVLTLVGSQPATPTVLIEAIYYDGYEWGDLDEAIRLMNASSMTVDLGGWSLTDGQWTVTLPQDIDLAPSQTIWCARHAGAFARQFGFSPNLEAGDSEPSVPEMLGSWPRLGNDGDRCLLQDGAGRLVDAVAFEDPGVSVSGWDGPAVEPWRPSPTFAGEGQILYRKRDQATGNPVADTNTAADWAQDPDDHIDGRKVLYPGWDLDAFFFTQRITQTATLTVAVAPDNLFETVSRLLANAQQSIQIEGYSFRSSELATVLLDRLHQGVSVTLLLEGAPAVEGVTDQEKWVVGQLYAAGAQVLFMINDPASQVHDRYKNQHAKFMIVDGTTVLIGSENLTNTSMPADDKENGTAGRRGAYLVTDAPGVVARVRALFDSDADPVHHGDIVGCDQVPHLCTPPAGYEPEVTPDWMTYTVQFPVPGTWWGTFPFEVIQSPENSLRTRDSLLGLLNRAGPGDTLLVQQLAEHHHWGGSQGTPQVDPNPRLGAYLDAARRGAMVRILLDGYFDHEGHNAETVTYLQVAARTEGLNLRVRQGNPTHLGLHNKMVLARVGGRGHVHVGSINGNEVSSKANRELALQVQSNEAYDYLRGVFEHDWRSAAPSVYVPLLLKGYDVPRPADHLLIGEVYYATIPEKEWVEIYNPTAAAIDLSPYKIGDAVYFDDYEGLYRFPPGTVISPNQVLVVAATAAGFREEFPDYTPDFEIFETDPAVSNLLTHAPWGEGDWGLSNAGDEVLLLDGSDLAVDVVVYGDGHFPGVVPHPGGIAFDHSLERYPGWLDSDDCSLDFRDWAFPSPGDLPW